MLLKVWVELVLLDGRGGVAGMSQDISAEQSMRLVEPAEPGLEPGL